MNVLSVSRRLLGVSMTTILLVSCGGPAQVLDPTSPVPGNSQNSIRPDRTGPAERLTATRISYRCLYSRGITEKTSFAASGSAVGSLPGTFTATGKWRLRSHKWIFSEAFTITTSGSQISGTVGGAGTESPSESVSCQDFSERPMDYAIGSGDRGTATVNFHGRKMVDFFEQCCGIHVETVPLSARKGGAI
jgi:hypothetical protein